jgi:uncharacterized cupredoxin-like copper-binding protein
MTTSRLFLLSMLGLAACRGAAPAPSLIRITSHDFDFQVPARIPAGLVHLRLVNQGPDIHEAMLARFTDPAGSAARYVDSVRADVDFPAFAIDIGGTGLAGPGDSNDVWLDLEPGRYVIVCWKGDHLSRGMARDLEVVADSATGVRPPESDITIQMTEYGYAVTGAVTPGSHVIKLENVGHEPHEADIVRLNAGQSAEEYLDWLRGGDVGLPPAEVIGGGGDFVAGRTVWMEVDLTPGRYLIICQVPRPDGKAHFELGMVKEFEVR